MTPADYPTLAVAPVSGDGDQGSLDLTTELARLNAILGAYLTLLRQRGRTTLGDAVGGAVIEDGEAEGILAELGEYAAHSDRPTRPDHWTSPLDGLERATQSFALLPAERDTLLLTISVEIDSRYGRLIAYLNDHVGRTRPTLGLAMSLFVPDAERARRRFIERMLEGPMQRYGLVQTDTDGPLVNRTLSVPEDFWPRLIGLQTETPFAVSAADDYLDNADTFDSEIRQQVELIAAWARGRGSDRKLVVVSGDAAAGRDEIASLVAARLRRSVLTIDGSSEKVIGDVRRIAREAIWHRAAVIVCNADGLDTQTHALVQQHISAPLVYVTARDCEPKGLETGRHECVELQVPELPLATRTRLWQDEADRYGLPVDASALASRFGFAPARIRRAVRLAGNQDAVSTSSADMQATLESVCRRMQRVEFSGLAHKLPCPFSESDIVLPDKTARELDLICTWARHGHDLFNDEGAGRNLRTGQGLACLFSGPPGTGKTMAAQVIGRRIGFDVYRIDLSQVVNKYVGETEKNLARVFDEAQRSKVVLFFDEAETLYGDRTDVKTAQDRFANIEVAYLLQRIETFEGVAILATNLQKNLDEAFLRRLSVVADFPIPEAEERVQIWSKLLPPADERSDDVDVDLLARQFRIAGGDIRNSIFSALLLAAEDERELGMEYLVRGLWRELQKSGRIVDTAQFGAWRDAIAS